MEIFVKGRGNDRPEHNYFAIHMSRHPTLHLCREGGNFVTIAQTTIQKLRAYGQFRPVRNLNSSVTLLFDDGLVGTLR